MRASAAHHVGRDLVQFTAARLAHPAKQADRVFARGLTAGHEEADRLAYGAAGDQVYCQIRGPLISTGRRLCQAFLLYDRQCMLDQQPSDDRVWTVPVILEVLIPAQHCIGAAVERIADGRGIVVQAGQEIAAVLAAGQIHGD